LAAWTLCRPADPPEFFVVQERIYAGALQHEP
jgi:hypothetical protein